VICHSHLLFHTRNEMLPLSRSTTLNNSTMGHIFSTTKHFVGSKHVISDVNPYPCPCPFKDALRTIFEVLVLESSGPRPCPCPCGLVLVLILAVGHCQIFFIQVFKMIYNMK